MAMQLSERESLKQCMHIVHLNALHNLYRLYYVITSVLKCIKFNSFQYKYILH